MPDTPEHLARDGPPPRRRGRLLPVALVAALVVIVVAAGVILDDDGTGDDAAATGTTGSTAPPTTTTSTTTTAPPAPPTTAAAPPPPAPAPAAGAALCIGDSVMLGASPAYLNTLSMCGTVDAEQSRQFSGAPAAVAAHAPYPSVVVVHLGNNVTVDRGDVDAVMSQLGGVPRVVFVTVQLRGTRSWESQANGEIHPASASRAASASGLVVMARSATPTWRSRTGRPPPTVTPTTPAATASTCRRPGAPSTRPRSPPPSEPRPGQAELGDGARSAGMGGAESRQLRLCRQ